MFPQGRQGRGRVQYCIQSGAINMGQTGSKKRDLRVQVLKAMLKTRGSKVKSLWLIQLLDFDQDTCPWFLEEGTVNLETWQKVGVKLKSHCKAEDDDDMPIFTFGLCSQIWDCLYPAPIYKIKMKS
jgi:hypothetical protein